MEKKYALLIVNIFCLMEDDFLATESVQDLFRADSFSINFQEWCRCPKGALVKNRPVKCEKANFRQSWGNI